MSIKVRFLAPDGSLSVDAEGRDGDRLLDLGQAVGQPLEGTCEGQMACSTCHVIVAEQDFARLPQPSEEEEDLLDLAAHVTRTSRLACQIVLHPELDGLTVRIPGSARNMHGR